MGAWTRSPQPLDNSCDFSEKKAILTSFLEQLEKAKFLGGGLGPKPPAAEQF